ncbi:MAG: alcohol dehydrogenase catalytic domain-containing protein [Candidatus Gastranaerophilales bacterium]|nr:alcohol dehydrogenase catalytic domain-containing protein [Candidatus Gastranaerophilales bacterium]
MRALVFDKELKLIDNYKNPTLKKGEALIKISTAGICNTDVEITKGYMGFSGICGHEFVGKVIEINDEDKTLLGKRVVGEINLGCENCPDCFNNMQRHCKNRETLGIFKKDGCFCEYLTMPLANLIEVPENISDEEAVLTEPIAAAFEILEQVHIEPAAKVAVLGDGKLGLLVSLVLSTTNAEIVTIGKHANKLEIIEKQGVKTQLLENTTESKCYDIVVDATGSVNGFEKAIELVKPRGILVLKSTVAAEKPLNLAPVVIDEITIVGSRCGQFRPALRLLGKKIFDFKSLISATYSFSQAVEAFKYAQEKGVLKVLLKFE